MTVAGFMLAHQVAAKGVRDAAFLSVWGPKALPAMVISTAVLVVAAVPVYARLLARFGPRRVVPTGFLLSAVVHGIEWRLSTGRPWVAIAVYLHVAGFGALLLSGFWSLVSELFDPKTAKVSFGRISAGGTIGGLLGCLVAARMASMSTQPLDSALLFLAVVHATCAVGVLVLGRASDIVFLGSQATPQSTRFFEFRVLRALPHLKTLGLMIVLSTAGAAVVDYLFKSGAKHQFTTGPELLRFFLLFYVAILVVTFLAQSTIGQAVRRFGLGRTISSLPAGFGASSVVGLLYPTFPVFAGVRAVESVLRGSLFRGGYELLFVPMDPDEKRRTKTFLDVTCDRAGDAVGAGIVQVLLFTGQTFLAAELLAVAIALAAGGLWLGRRLDVMYLGVVERRLIQQAEHTPLVVGSETGWTVLDIAPSVRAARSSVGVVAVPTARREEDPRLRSLADLRSGDRQRVENALRRLSNPDVLHVAQVIQLLAWDDMVTSARKLLEKVAPSHVGLLVDELLNPDADFAIRRRIPRILGTLSSDRALDGLIRGLDDSRFEVRYQCSRAIDRVLRKTDGLAVDRGRILNVVERELSVPAQVWHGHRLIDRVERDDETATESQSDRPEQNLEHIFSLLAAVLPREPLQVAFRGIGSENPGLRALAFEYLDSVLPAAVRSKLEELTGT
jgi:AAA family ATP:ADP antiporter